MEGAIHLERAVGGSRWRGQIIKFVTSKVRRTGEISDIGRAT
jgi:hypothetical protein